MGSDDVIRSVPDSFTLLQTTDGSQWGGFNDLIDQQRFIFGRRDGAYGALMLAMAKPAAARTLTLFGTEETAGTPIDVGVPGASAVYHDGMWSPGAGPRETTAGAIQIHWETAVCHSIVATTKKQTVAVRSWHSNGLTVDDLVSITRSLAGAA